MEENRWMNDVKNYADMFRELELTELSVKDGDKELKLKKEVLVSPASSAAAAPLVKGASADNVTSLSENKEDDDNYKKINAPLLGMFHAAPSPDSEPFVKVGDHVKKGDVLCIIEAMKMMNDITATADGIVEKICVNENDIVEYGQTLFLLS